MAVISIPRPLREKLGDDASDALASILNQLSENQHKSTTQLVEEKFERLTEELAPIKSDLLLLNWMIGLVLGGIVALILKTFFPV